MSNQRRRDDWQRRAAQVQQVCSDPQLALWQKAHLVGKAYADVQLDGLKSKHRHKIFGSLSQVNAILARYPIETFDDYAQINADDLKAIVNAK